MGSMYAAMKGEGLSGSAQVIRPDHPTEAMLKRWNKQKLIETLLHQYETAPDTREEQPEQEPAWMADLLALHPELAGPDGALSLDELRWQLSCARDAQREQAWKCVAQLEEISGQLQRWGGVEKPKAASAALAASKMARLLAEKVRAAVKAANGPARDEETEG